MAIETYERTADSGQFVKLGDRSPNGAAADATGTDLPAAPDPGNASAGQSGETSAPPSETPSGTPPAQAAPGDTALGDDDEPEPEVATMDYVQRRIRRLTAQRRASERALETERASNQQTIAELRAQMQLMTQLMQGSAPEVPSAPPADPTQPPPRPNAADYSDQAAYDRDMDTWMDRRTQYTLRQQTQVQQAQQALLDREAAFARDHADYQAVVRDHLAGKVAPHVQQALMLLPEGPALAYALAQQPETVQRLNQLPPPLVFLELGRLAPPPSPPAGNGAAPTPPPVPTNGTTPAPLAPPLSGVSGQGTTPPPGYREGMTMDEYRRYRQQTSTLPVWKQR